MNPKIEDQKVLLSQLCCNQSLYLALLPQHFTDNIISKCITTRIRIHNIDDDTISIFEIPREICKQMKILNSFEYSAITIDSNILTISNLTKILEFSKKYSEKPDFKKNEKSKLSDWDKNFFAKAFGKYDDRNALMNSANFLKHKRLINYGSQYITEFMIKDFTIEQMKNFFLCLE
jgi:hypothetical protein